MAGGEDQAQQVVADGVVETRVDGFGLRIARRFVQEVEFTRNLVLLAGGEPGVA